MKKKLVSVLLTASMAATVLAGCGGASAPAAAPAAQEEAKEEAPAEEKEEAAAPAAEAGAGKVYYLNFKPEADPQWQELAKAYTEETGVPVTVVTAASGEYPGSILSTLS